MVQARRKSQARLPTNRQLLWPLILFVVCALLSRGGGLGRGERFVFDLLSGLPELLTPIMLIISLLGSLLALFLIVVYFLFNDRTDIAAKLVKAGLLAYGMAVVISWFFGPHRNEALLLDNTYKDLVYGPGFPSIQVALGTAIILSLQSYVPKNYNWLVPVAIVSLGISKVYLGTQTPIDAIGGFALGWLAVLLYRRYFSLKKQQKVES